MRQVPQYAIIGNGRLAKHLAYYFDQLNIGYTHWHRQQQTITLQTACQNATHALILISDSQIDRFIEEHQPILENVQYLIHCSASINSKYAHTAHPLQTFTETLYTMEEYQTIPFIIEKNGPEFEKLLPDIPNQHYAIPAENKAYYHSLCVMANNFSTLLWQNFFNKLEDDLNIPYQAGIPILTQTFKNLINDHPHALTGPISRGDTTTLYKNLQALQHDSYAPIFEAFMKTHTNYKEP